jgi:YidC/Oxa1 family membrane protein insertase
MEDQNKNLILATALSFLVILVWFLLFPPPEPVTDPNAVATTDSATAPLVDQNVAAVPSQDVQTDAPAAQVEAAPRLPISSDRLSGSISLAGGRIDDLKLTGYRETTDADSPAVTLFSPVGEAEAYYALYGWAPGADLNFEDVPGANTLWSVESGTTLGPDTPVTLVWNNDNGLVFRRKISVDHDYLFSVEQSVQNTGATAARLAPNNALVHVGQPSDLKGFFILHEGAIRQTGEERNYIKWDDITEFGTDPRWGMSSEAVQVAQNGWVGFTDHYWMAMLIPDADQAFESVVQYVPNANEYRTVTRLATVTVEPGQTVTVTSDLFAGAKEWETIRAYQNDAGIHEFLDTIDWGWFFFLTKPIFAMLHWLNSIIGNMGWSIIALTLVIKAIVLPLAYKSYVSMARMKELQPEMEKLKERAGEDRQKMQKDMMELYKKEKVNPASGCLPILVQIPIFFSLYKVIFVTLELRHAPWIGWIDDLSAPDPSSILNLFGLLPYAAPDPNSLLAIISLGVLPILLGISMWLQQKLNPTPTDATQAMIFAWMPWVFMFMLGQFASGLVLYWIANNTITFMQQFAIMTSHGARPDVFGNIKKSVRKEKPAKK